MAAPLIASNPALAAYAEATKRAAGTQVNPGDGDRPSFSDLLARSVSDAIDSSRNSESVSVQAASGRANLQDVVEAVNAAELSLQTVVSIRDRVISAYQEIMRMPI
ncbi:MAG: flagellar hook-basal body complex protein FliE [Geminicoccaceae bacterium]